MTETRKVGYIYSEDLATELNKISVITDRAKLVHSLIKSYGLLDRLHLFTPRPATNAELNSFHSSDYIAYLETDTVEDDEQDSEYGLSYDCPKLENMMNFCKTVAGGTLTAAEGLLSGFDTVINWNGGWHHAHRDSAAGFCYVNDIVLGIQKLSERFKRILYVDLDVHHGDGVEEAFSTTKRVLTLSFHVHEPGFFPCSGGVGACGFGPGKGYSLNAPYRFNIGSKFCSYFEEIFNLAVAQFAPEVFVVQCGADVLSGDPIGGANVSIQDMERCVKCILAQNGPKMFLGGGGYNVENASRYWTKVTAVILGETLDEDIPDNEFFLRYGPDYTINHERSKVRDSNSDQFLQDNARVLAEKLKGL